VKQPEPSPGFDFDVTNTEQIFDMLMKEKYLVPVAGHQTPSAEEIRGRKYYKWHDRFDGHNTNECRILRIEIQKAIEQGRLVFTKAPMKIDTKPFSANVVSTVIPPWEGEASLAHMASVDFRDRVQTAVTTGRVLKRPIEELPPELF
jgi:hypothetical protein